MPTSGSRTRDLVAASVSEWVKTEQRAADVLRVATSVSEWTEREFEGKGPLAHARSYGGIALDGLWLREPRPFRFRREVIPEAVAVERGVRPTRDVDKVAFPQHGSRIVWHSEGGKRSEIAGVLGRPAASQRVVGTLFQSGVRHVPMIPENVVYDLHLAHSLPRYAAVKSPLNSDPRPTVVAIRVTCGRIRGNDPAMPVGVHACDPLRGRIVFDPHDFMVARIVVARESEIVFPEKMIGDDRLFRMKDRGDVFERKKLVRHVVQPGRELLHERALRCGRRGGRLGRK